VLLGIALVKTCRYKYFFVQTRPTGYLKKFI
jgi:hypothetical protein